jgi:hypothetical protein
VLHVTDGSETLAQLFQVSSDGHRPPYNLWYILTLMALVLYFLDIVARKLPPAEQWLERFGWQLPRRWRVSRQQEGSTDGSGVSRSRPAPFATGEAIPGELYVARLRGRSPQGGAGRGVRR